MYDSTITIPSVCPICIKEYCLVQMVTSQLLADSEALELYKDFLRNTKTVCPSCKEVTMQKSKIDCLKIFTPAMIEAAKVCMSVRDIESKVIIPNMAYINEQSGQENSSLYFAYAMQFFITRSEQ
jgi:hypothetical protein